MNLFSDRKNSSGVNMNIVSIQRPFFAKLKELESKQWLAGPIVDGETLKRNEARVVLSPQDVSLTVGKIHWADEQAVEQALASAHAAFPRWRETPVSERAAALEKLADLLEANREQFISSVLARRASCCRTASTRCARRWTSAATTRCRPVA